MEWHAGWKTAIIVGMNRSGFFAAVLASCLASPAGAQTITRGPFLQQLCTDGIVVVWETDSDTDGRVEYGLTAGLGDSVLDSTRAHHEVALTGLQSSTSYHYKVVSGGTESPVGVFSTAPLAHEPFRFVVFGDNRDEDGDHFNHEALMPAIILEAPDFVINTGDMVDVGLSSPMWDRFFEIERELLRDVPLWPTFGNHEQWDFANLTYLKIFSLPPQSNGEEERYYEFRHGNSHFIVTNTHDILYGTYYSLAQQNFIEASLAAAATDPEVKHIFLVGHHGPYSSSNHGGSPSVRNFIEGLAQLDRVDYFFAGHDHCYERWVGDGGLKGFVTGGGGAGLYSQDDPGAGYSRFFCKCYNYLLVEVAGGWVRVCPKTQDGTLIEPCLETGDLPRDCATPEDCQGLPHDPCPGAWSCTQGMCIWTCGEGEPDAGIPDAGGDDAGGDSGGDVGDGDDGVMAGDDGRDVGDGDPGTDRVDPEEAGATDGDGLDGDGVGNEVGGDDTAVEPDQDAGESGCGCGSGRQIPLVWLAIGGWLLIVSRRSTCS